MRRAEEAFDRSVEMLRKARRSLSDSELGRLDRPADHAVSIQPASANPKLAPQRSVEARSGRNRYEPVGPYVASTYTSIAATCPEVCPFRDNGCFAQAGAQHLTMGSLDRAGRRTTALEVSLAEAAKLDRLWARGVPLDGHRGNGRDLRLHVGGDVSCARGARALARAVWRLRNRGLGSAWTYTHRWRDIPAQAWGPIRVFASCETADDVTHARRRGYRVAVTVPLFPRGRFEVAPGVRGVACPFESGRQVTCATCRLCLDAQLPFDRAIVFAAHGAAADKAKHVLRGQASS